MDRDRRVFVLGLDGVPHSFLQRGIESGQFPCLRALAERAGMKKIRSELPTVSSVAWTSFITGTNPATHGVLGFVDRVAETGELFIPTGRNRRAPAIWKRLSDQGRSAIAINVPASYPPEQIQGCVIAGFLCPALKKVTPRSDVAQKLKEIDYVIDVEAALGRQADKQPFLDQLRKALDRRRELAHWLLDHEPWDYFQLHIMETDRINHFLWDAMEDPNHPDHKAFFEFYRAVDSLAGELIERVSGDARWLVLSDHGFCRARHEVNVNALLRDFGFLKYRNVEGMTLDPIEPESKAFSLLPGRIYVNLKGREAKGTVPPSDYEFVVKDVASALESATHPESGERLFTDVCATRDIYEGPLLDIACDLIAVPRDGIDLRAGFRAEGSPFGSPSIPGIHTYDDAFVIADGGLAGDEDSIRDVGRRVGEVLL